MGAAASTGVVLTEDTQKAMAALPEAAQKELAGLMAAGKYTKTRYNTLRESPAGAKYKLCVVQFKVPGATNGGSDKGPDGNRVDSIPIVTHTATRTDVIKTNGRET